LAFSLSAGATFEPLTWTSIRFLLWNQWVGEFFQLDSSTGWMHGQ
jgi:hypothetical protein